MIARHCRLALVILMVGMLLLSACAPTSRSASAPTAAPAAPTAEKVAAAPTAAPTVAPTEAPTAAPTKAHTKAPTEEPTAEPTDAPTAKPTAKSGMAPKATAVPADEGAAEEETGLTEEAVENLSAAIGETVAEGYAVLLMIDASAVALGETAESISTGDIDPFAAMGSLLVLPFMLQMVDEELAKGAPDPVLEDAWEEALVVMPMVQEVAAAWFGEEITPDKVPTRLKPVYPKIDAMIALADEALIDEYDVDPDDLATIRAMMIEEVRKGLREAMSGMEEGFTEGGGDKGAGDIESDAAIAFNDIIWWLDGVGDLVFVGELENVSEETVGVVEVTVTVLDDDGEAIASGDGIALVSAIEPGGVAPFVVDFLQNPGEFADYEVVARAGPFDEDWNANFYTSFRVTRASDKGVTDRYYELILEAENVGAAPASLIEAIVTAYDDDGKIVGAGSSMAKQSRVLPGDPAAFDISFAVSGEVDSYAVLFDAYAEEIDELPDLEIANLVWLIDDWDDVYCVGEIINHSDEPVNGVSIAVTVDDADGELVTTDVGTTGLEIIPAGGVSPFKVTFWDDVPEDGDYSAVVNGDFANEYALESWYTDFEIIEHTLDYDEDDLEVVVSGRVRNTGDTKAESVKVVLTGYDEEEDVVVAETGYLEIDTLKPGGTAPFLIDVYCPVPVTDYVLQVEAYAAN